VGGGEGGGLQITAGLADERAGLAVATGRDVAEWEGMHGRGEERGRGGRMVASRGEEDASSLPPHDTSDFVWPTRKSDGCDAPRPGKPVHSEVGVGDVFTASPLAGNISTFFESVLPPHGKGTFYA